MSTTNVTSQDPGPECTGSCRTVCETIRPPPNAANNSGSRAPNPSGVNSKYKACPTMGCTFPDTRHMTNRCAMRGRYALGALLRNHTRSTDARPVRVNQPGTSVRRRRLNGSARISFSAAATCLKCGRLK